MTLRDRTKLEIARLLYRAPIGYQARDLLFAGLKRLNDFEVTKEFPDGLRLCLDTTDYIGFRLVERGHWEQSTLNAIRTLLGDGGVFLDVGAHCGYFAVAMAHEFGDRIRVIGFEPNERVASIARRNVALNRMRNVTFDGRAISSENGSTVLYVQHAGNAGYSGFLKRFGATHPQTVQTVTLLDALREHRVDTITLLKMDIEGAEALVLPTIADALREGRIQSLLLELHPKAIAEFGRTARELVDLLQPHFHLYGLSKRGLTPLDLSGFPPPASASTHVAAVHVSARRPI